MYNTKERNMYSRNIYSIIHDINIDINIVINAIDNLKCLTPPRLVGKTLELEKAVDSIASVVSTVGGYVGHVALVDV